MSADRPVVGIIANPVSARDIRRIVAYAGNLQITDRANIVLHLLAGLGAVGIDRVLVMPEYSGIRQHVVAAWSAPEAARRMRAAGVAAIIVLGGDGTHRAVVSACGDIPITGVSTRVNRDTHSNKKISPTTRDPNPTPQIHPSSASSTQQQPLSCS